VAEAAAAGAEREVTRLARHVELRTGLALAAAALLLLAGGYALGRWDGAGAATGKAEALGGAALLAQVAELNDLAALRRHCDRSAYQQDGALACTLPPVWMRRPSR
jgi:hypothetical protein